MKSRVNKNLVAKRFGQRTATYEKVTPVQEQMADALMLRVQAHQFASTPRIIELGCGTGRLTRRLLEAFPEAELTVVDISPQMVARTRRDFPGIQVCQADAEAFVEEVGGAVDLVVSNATVQWFQHPAASVRAWYDRLARGGLLALATFGAGTFAELSAAFDDAYRALEREPKRHVLRLPHTEFWEEIIPGLQVDESDIQLTFPNVRRFLKSIQDAGATHSTSQPSPLPRDLYKQMLQCYADRFSLPDGQITAGYHVLYLTACA